MSPDLWTCSTKSRNSSSSRWTPFVAGSPIGEGERRQTLLSELQRLWQDEFEPTSARIRAMSSDENLPEVTWPQVAAELAEAAAASR